MNPILGMGAAYQRLFQFLPWWLLVTAAAALGTYLSCRRIDPDLAGTRQGLGDRVWRILLAPLDLGRDWAWFACGCALLMLLADYHGFTQGFFRWDDFAFVQDAREGMPLARLLNMYHSDHSLPLFRLWVSGIVGILGPSATADDLARAFNAVNFATCLGVLMGGVALLAGLGAKRATAALFCLFAWSWPGWGEFTSGFYTLIVYPQTLVLGLASVVQAVRYLRGASAGWMAGSVACAVLACGLDVSGVWVFPAVGGFCLAIGGLRSPPARRLAPWLLAGLVLASYYHLVWFRHPFEGREFEQNPGGLSVGHSLGRNLAAHFWRLPLTLESGVAGALLSAVLPGTLGAAASGFNANLPRSAPIYAAEALLLAGVAWLAWRKSRRISSADRRLFAAICLPVLILIGMTAVARADGLNLPGSLWPSKYFCVPQVWAVLAAVFMVDRVALASVQGMKRSARWVAAAGATAVWMMSSQWYLESAIAVHVARQPAGREGNAEAARLRRRDFERLERDFTGLARSIGSNRIVVPPPDGIYWAYPYLEYGYDPELGGCYSFADLLSVAPNLGITLQERPAALVPPATMRAIEQSQSLRRVFDPEPPAPAPVPKT